MMIISYGLDKKHSKNISIVFYWYVTENKVIGHTKI